MMPHEYRDGVGAMRCRACGSALRDAAEGPLVSIREADLDRVVLILADLPAMGLDNPLTAALLARLAHVAGQSVAQLRARQSEGPDA
jgi:hypothetical protein